MLEILAHRLRKSRVVLMGASEFPRDPKNLLPLPQVKNNIKELQRLLTNPEVIGIPEKQGSPPLLDPQNSVQALETFAEVCNSAEDTLLVYYSGHGLVGTTGQGELFLATAGTTQARAELNALAFEQIRRIINTSPLPERRLILDCCFSGRAIERYMGSGEQIFQEKLGIQGTYAIASAPAETSRPSRLRGHSLRLLQESSFGR